MELTENEIKQILEQTKNMLRLEKERYIIKLLDSRYPIAQEWNRNMNQINYVKQFNTIQK